MNILPVLDLTNGVVVRGVGGRRREYRPIVSQLTTSVDPLDVAQALHDRFGFDEFYLADLDAIAGRPPSLPVFARLLNKGHRLWVDAGLGSDLTHTRLLADIGIRHIIAGLESLEGPAQLRQLLDVHGPSSLIFSLDMKHGQPLAGDAWSRADAWDIAGQAVRFGVLRMLVLDLAAVGVNRGTPTAELCGRLRTAFPSLEISTGGGIRGVDDLRKLQQAGIDHVLVASALHDGRLTPDDLRGMGN